MKVCVKVIHILYYIFCHGHVTYQLCQPLFTAIYNSSPVVSWDSKMSSGCALQKNSTKLQNMLSLYDSHFMNT